MKKLYFFCIALVALMLASCGGKDYREMLPADSFVIVSINPESLSRKAQVGDFTQSVYYKMAEQALARCARRGARTHPLFVGASFGNGAGCGQRRVYVRDDGECVADRQSYGRRFVQGG